MYLVNFANLPYSGHQHLSNELAQMYGIQNIYSFSDTTLTTLYPDFIKKHEHILRQPRGCGYWLWKPLIIRETLRHMPEGEVLMYLDSGAILVSSPHELFELAKSKEKIFFEIPDHKNSVWTKRDVFVELNCDTPEYWEADQVTAQVHFWKNTSTSRDMVDTWLSWCQKPQLLTDLPSQAENLPGFRDHRHDQSILSLMVRQAGLELFRLPTQEGLLHCKDYPNSSYGLIIAALGRPGAGKETAKAEPVP